MKSRRRIQEVAQALRAQAPAPLKPGETLSPAETKHRACVITWNFAAQKALEWVLGSFEASPDSMVAVLKNCRFTEPAEPRTRRGRRR